jgi:threonine dehydrogenase-like Zn-dependent dehydrogenase
MGERYRAYRSLNYPLTETNVGWNLYGAGLESLGRDGAPEIFPIPAPDDDQLLVRIDSVSMCFSDTKVIKQGSSHPKLVGRDLAADPTRLGHEVSLTVVRVGRHLQGTYFPGQRLAVQPDIYQQGKSTAYGYTIPGGLIQYHLIGKEVLETDEGACLLPVADDMGYAESSLLEPWGCVMAAYTQRRRLEPKPGGTMWIVGQPGDTTAYTFSKGLAAPATIVLTDAPASVKRLAATSGAKLVECNGIGAADFETLKAQQTQGAGFDDIVILNPTSASQVGQIARQIARRGTCNLVGAQPLDGLVAVDLGRLHYDALALVGSPGPDIAASYGVERNRCDLRPGGVAVFIGAGGPMGQMHVQRALEMRDGPELVIATEVNAERLQTLKDMFVPLAEKQARRILFFNPATAGQSFYDFVMQATQGQGADDVIASAPIASLMEDGDAVMKPDGMLVLFAGVANGTMGKVKLSNVALANAQYTGTSGLSKSDQAAVMERRLAGTLSPGRSVAAIGGLEAAQAAYAAVIEGRYPGKIVLFPQIHNLPLTGLQELKDRLPEVAHCLGENGMWTNAAEEALIEALWQQPG